MAADVDCSDRMQWIRRHDQRTRIRGVSRLIFVSVT